MSSKAKTTCRLESTVNLALNYFMKIEVNFYENLFLKNQYN